MRRSTRLGEVAALWQVAASADHAVVKVADLAWERYVTEVRSLLRSLDREDEDQDGLDRALRTSLSRLLYTPCSPSRMVAGLDLASLFERAGASGANVTAAVAALGELQSAAPVHPYRSWLDANGSSLAGPVRLVTKASYLVPFLDDAVDAFPQVAVVTPNRLAILPTEGSVVVLGPAVAYPRWMRAFPRGETTWLTWRWSAPPSLDLRFIPDGEGRSARPSVRTVPWPERGPGGPVVVGSGTFDVSEAEPVDPRDLYERLRRRRRREREVDPSDEMDVVVANVGEGQIVLLPADDDVKTTVFDPEAVVVRGLPQRSIKPGMFIVVRSRMGRDHIRELVEERFLADPEAMKRSLTEWKSLLRQRLRLSGHEAVYRALRARGVGVTQGTVATWAGDFTYGPGDYEAFKVLMLYLDFFDFDERWAVLQAYRAAGKKAGAYVRERLLDQVRRMDLAAAAESRVLEFELDGVEQGKLSLYRVEEVFRDPVRASGRDIGRLMDASEV